MDLTEAADIKKVRQEYTEELYKENRDYGVHVMLGNDWTVKHIPAESISSKPDVFGRAIRQWANRQKK